MTNKYYAGKVYYKDDLIGKTHLTSNQKLAIKEMTYIAMVDFKSKPDKFNTLNDYGKASFNELTPEWSGHLPFEIDNTDDIDEVDFGEEGFVSWEDELLRDYFFELEEWTMED